MHNFFFPSMLNRSFFSWWFTPLLIWSFVWKGLALWRSARNHHLYWYLALLVLNTAGLLEIAYLAFFQNKGGCQCFGRCDCPDCSCNQAKAKLKKKH